MPTTLPIRPRYLADHMKEAYGEGGDELREAITGMLGTEDENALMQVAASAYIQATLELACTLWTKDQMENRKNCAERILALAKWMIKQWGTDGGEIISRVGIIGIVLTEEMGDKWTIAFPSGKGVGFFTLRDLFTDAIPNARAIMAGTYKNSLG